jgi:hypothetical protein
MGDFLPDDIGDDCAGVFIMVLCFEQFGVLKDRTALAVFHVMNEDGERQDERKQFHQQDF